ncbi:DUF4932 domain-containing protein [Algoriphagus sp. SE2]|uniref:DUF4932 domain-containing protein n=1 Tax=Algoriphagus sp. SE2 TaxID=3141536 RepID=UPI0031CD9A25
MKKAFLLWTLFCCVGVHAQTIEIRFNKNIELLGYLIELGDPSENDPNHPISIAINQFPEDKNNPALAKLFELGETMDYSTLVQLMYRLPEFPHKEGMEYSDEILSSTAFDPKLIQSIFEQVNQFSKLSHFDELWDNLEAARSATSSLLDERKPSMELITELERFYGQSYAAYEIVPSLTLWSGSGFGIRSQEENKATFVLGPLVKNYDFTSEVFSSLTIHEFGHSFVNHIVEENSDIISKTSELFEEIESSMRQQGYTNWPTCVLEHFVRAGEVIIPELMGDHTTSQSNLQYHTIEKDFIYLEYLIDRLKEYRLNQGLLYSEAVSNTMKDFQIKLQPENDQVETIQGVVQRKESNEPIPFAHIGVPGKNLGTISRPDGSFEIDLSQASPTDSLVFSSLGFLRKAFPVSDLTTYLDVSLEEEANLLQEVVVTAKREQAKSKKLGRIKPSKRTRGQNGLKEFGFGGEQGIRIKATQPYLLEEVSFHMRFNTVDSALFRLNIYRVDEDGLPEKSLLKQDLFVKSKKGQKWIRKELEANSLLIDQDLVITYEVVQVWFSDTSTNALYLTFGKGYPEGGAFLRRSSMDQWITETPDAFPITLYVSVKVYEDGEQ